MAALKDDYTRGCVVVGVVPIEEIEREEFKKRYRSRITGQDPIFGWYYKVKYTENDTSYTVVAKLCADKYFKGIRLERGEIVYVEFWRSGRRDPVIYYR